MQNLLYRVPVLIGQVPLPHPHRELPGQETLLVLVLGAVGGGEDVPVGDEGAAAPELPPSLPVQEYCRHPGHLHSTVENSGMESVLTHLPLERLVAAHNPALGHPHLDRVQLKYSVHNKHMVPHMLHVEKKMK